MSDPTQGGAQAGIAPIREGTGRVWLPITVAVIALDQFSKAWIVEHFALHERKTLLPVLDITLTYNTGAAFSFLAGASGWQRWLFVALAIGVSGAIVGWLGRLKARSQGLLSCSLAFILGGALGNVLDRLRIGHVVDFVLAHWNEAYFPAFNVADSAITVGAALLLLDAWRESQVSGRS